MPSPRSQANGTQAFLRDAWSLTAITMKCDLMLSIENTEDQSHSHGKRTLLALSLPDSWDPLGIERESSFRVSVTLGWRGRSGLSSEVSKAPEFLGTLPPPSPSPLFPSSSLLPKYENCKSVLFISINPQQCAPQGRGSHGNPANSCLKNSSCLMQSMCLIHLKVSWWGGGSGRRKHEDLFFWVLLGSWWKGDGGRGMA